jgi:hypothetical protein
MCVFRGSSLLNLYIFPMCKSLLKYLQYIIALIFSFIRDSTSLSCSLSFYLYLPRGNACYRKLNVDHEIAILKLKNSLQFASSSSLGFLFHKKELYFISSHLQCAQKFFLFCSFISFIFLFNYYNDAGKKCVFAIAKKKYSNNKWSSNENVKISQR